MPRRANSEGSIYRDGDRWVAALVVGRRDDGRLIRRRFVARTRKAVTAKLDAARTALDQGLALPDARTTVAEFVHWWAEQVLPAEGLAPATEQWYRDVLKHYVVPAVGHRTLSGPKALTPGDVETLTGQLARAGRSHRVQEAARTTLGKVLRAAESRGLATRNVARIAKAPRDRGKARKVKALTVVEVAALLDAVAGTPWHPVVVVGVTTGLRPAELLALHWPDVHLAGDPHLSVRHAFTYVDGPTLKAPKRDRSYRTVPLVAEAVDALRRWRKTQATERLAAGELWSPDWPNLVFTAPDGTPRRVDVYRQALRRAVPGAHPHRLRHSYATHLLEGGTPVHHVAELLGDSVVTVEATYSHVLRTKHEVAALARGLLGGAT
jgi:integrase